MVQSVCASSRAVTRPRRSGLYRRSHAQRSSALGAATLHASKRAISVMYARSVRPQPICAVGRTPPKAFATAATAADAFSPCTRRMSCNAPSTRWRAISVVARRSSRYMSEQPRARWYQCASLELRSRSLAGALGDSRWVVDGNGRVGRGRLLQTDPRTSDCGAASRGAGRRRAATNSPRRPARNRQPCVRKKSAAVSVNGDFLRGTRAPAAPTTSARPAPSA